MHHLNFFLSACKGILLWCKSVSRTPGNLPVHVSNHTQVNRCIIILRAKTKQRLKITENMNMNKPRTVQKWIFRVYQC